MLEFIKLQGVHYVMLWIEILHLPEHKLASAMPRDTIKRTPAIRTMLTIPIMSCTSKGFFSMLTLENISLTLTKLRQIDQLYYTSMKMLEKIEMQ
jgi:deoxycytidine triphosphate deaminase